MAKYDLDEDGFVKIELVDNWYVMLYESRHSGWIAEISTETECKIAQCDEEKVVYCFRVNRMQYSRLKLLSFDSLLDMDCLSIIDYMVDSGEKNGVVIDLVKLKKQKLLTF